MLFPQIVYTQIKRDPFALIDIKVYAKQCYEMFEFDIDVQMGELRVLRYDPKIVSIDEMRERITGFVDGLRWNISHTNRVKYYESPS